MKPLHNLQLRHSVALSGMVAAASAVAYTGIRLAFFPSAELGLYLGLALIVFGLFGWFRFRPKDYRDVAISGLITACVFLLVRLTVTLLSESVSPLGHIETFFFLPVVYVIAYGIPNLGEGRRIAKIFLALFLSLSLGFLISSEVVKSQAVSSALIWLNVSNLLAFFTIRGLTQFRSSYERTETRRQVLNDMADYDVVTGFYTRSAFSSRASGYQTVVIIDTDTSNSLKIYPGELIDAHIAAVARAVSALAQPGVVFGRINDSTLAVGLEEVWCADQMHEYAANLYAATGAEGTNSLSLAIGVASGEENTLSRAKLALTKAEKATVGQRVHFFDPVVDAALEQLDALKHDTCRALAEDKFSLNYQPVVELHNHKPVYVEALARWIDDKHGFVPPDQFIPVIEANVSTLVQFERWLLRKACSDIQSLGNLGVSVNISARTFISPTFVGEVCDALSETGFAPERLQLEITESSTLIDEAQVQDNFTALRNLGVRIALDDFGSGYASLGYMFRYPFSTIKVDREFADAGETRRGVGRAIYAAVAAIAAEMGAHVVAEGLENAEAAQTFMEYGVAYGQGYGFARPLKLADLKDYLQTELPELVRDEPLVKYVLSS